jgi:hypothetical protein
VQPLRGTVVHETFAFRAFCAVRRLAPALTIDACVKPKA